MLFFVSVLLTVSLAFPVSAECPYTDPTKVKPRQEDSGKSPYSRQFLRDYEISDEESSYLTSDAGGPISDQASLKAGKRGSTLLEDFIFRQKITHFDHERVSAGYLLNYSASIR